MADFDLAVIGGGTGNGLIGPEIAHWNIAIVEKDVFGGTCLNRGCIPSKMFVHAADIAEEARDSSRFGVDAHLDGVRWPDVRDRVFGRIDPLGPGSERERRDQDNVTVFSGSGRLTGPGRVAVGNDTEFTADRIVLAAGARPMVPAFPGLDDVTAHTTDSIMRLDSLPEHLIIIGAGFIAAEMAHIFGGLGSRVSILMRGERLLKAEDAEISEAFTKAYASRFELHRSTQIERLATKADGNIDVHVAAAGGRSTITGDTLLIATGRIPNSDALDVAAAGVKTNAAGFVITDETFRTNVPGIWAFGDMTNAVQLKHFANAQRPAVLHNLLNPDESIEVTPRHVPHAVFAGPQVAAVGRTEAQLVADGVPFVVGKKYYSGTAFGWALEDEHSFCKVLADPETRELLGAHIIGPQASLLIQQLVLGMELGLTVEQLSGGQMYIHPALSEVVENALLNVD